MPDNTTVNKVVLGDEVLLDLTGDTATEADVASGKTFHLASGALATGTASGGGLFYGAVDSTSTATKFTATIEGVTNYYDGLAIMLKNGVVTSAAGFTIDINGLGAKQAYTNLAAATAETTVFNVNYTMLFVYDSTRVSGGGWICYRGYDSNTNTIGYQLRTNSSTRATSDRGYRYRLWFTSADNTKWVPANTSTATNATTARTMNTRPINPFGPIGYYATNATLNAGDSPTATAMWQQYTLTIGYSYMASGFALTSGAPVYLKAAPQEDGSAVMESIVTSLPTAKDGKIYIYLGQAYSTTAMELRYEHPVYWHDGTGVRLWTGAESGGSFASIGHFHGDITNTGDILVAAPKIASGDKLVINDESASKVTNGPSFGTSVNTFLANNGTWQTPSVWTSISTDTIFPDCDQHTGEAYLYMSGSLVYLTVEYGTMDSNGLFVVGFDFTGNYTAASHAIGLGYSGSSFFPVFVSPQMEGVYVDPYLESNPGPNSPISFTITFEV